MMFLELGVRGGGKEVVADRWWLRRGSLLVQDMSYEGMLGVC
jgi:GMP synthase-like glutamine amidotransferase